MSTAPSCTITSRQQGYHLAFSSTLAIIPKQSLRESSNDRAYKEDILEPTELKNATTEHTEHTE
jgi:hypothetical protein